MGVLCDGQNDVVLLLRFDASFVIFKINPKCKGIICLMKHVEPRLFLGDCREEINEIAGNLA